MSTPRATEIINAQGRLEPGEEGYWKVWGASIRDIQRGDLVILKRATEDGKGEVCEYEVGEYAPREVRVTAGRPNTAYDDMTGRGHTGGGVKMDQIRPRWRATDGELFTVGAMQPIGLLRKSTHNILSDYVK